MSDYYYLACLRKDYFKFYQFDEKMLMFYYVKKIIFIKLKKT